MRDFIRTKLGRAATAAALTTTLAATSLPADAAIQTTTGSNGELTVGTSFEQNTLLGISDPGGRVLYTIIDNNKIGASGQHTINNITLPTETFVAGTEEEAAARKSSLSTIYNIKAYIGQANTPIPYIGQEANLEHLLPFVLNRVFVGDITHNFNQSGISINAEQPVPINLPKDGYTAVVITIKPVGQIGDFQFGDEVLLRTGQDTAPSEPTQDGSWTWMSPNVSSLETLPYIDYDVRNTDPSIDVYRHTSLSLSFSSVAGAVPEPSTFGLMGVGLAGAAVAARRKKAESFAPAT